MYGYSPVMVVRIFWKSENNGKEYGVDCHGEICNNRLRKKIHNETLRFRKGE